MKTKFLLGAVASICVLLSACDEAKLEGQLALVGGALHGCSSMAASDCRDWDAFRTTELAHLTDDQIRIPVELGVSLSNSKIDDVITDSAWNSSLIYKSANEEILMQLQQALEAPDYLFDSWDSFKSAYIGYGDTSVANGEGGKVSGNDVWFNSSDAQWSTLAKLEIVDDTFQYTVTEEKVDSILSQVDIAALEPSTYDGLAATLGGSVYGSPVLNDELIEYFGELNLVDATVNGWKLFKKFLSDDEFNFMLDTLDPLGSDQFVIDSTAIDTIENDDSVVNNGEGWDEYNRSDLISILTFLLGGELEVSYSSYDDFRNAMTSVYLDNSDEEVEFNHEFGSDVWSALSTIEQTLIFQMLVDPLENYSRPLEYVDFDGSSDAETVNVVKAIVEKAKGNSEQSPVLLVMTSSSNNSYDAVDYYVSLFNQAGAEAQWLPIDRAYQDARMAERCDLIHAYHGSYASEAHVELLFPDYADEHLSACQNPQSLLDLINLADAVFINGGGQRRSLDALMPLIDGVRIDSPEMALIRARFEKGELLVAGTSAGTAVQGGGFLNADSPINPMIDGGQSYDVTQTGFDDGIAVFEGGTGLFNYGITDTHFSERARETRLIKLAEQTGVQFGFGVDETTVLLMDKFAIDNRHVAKMSVVGKGGVFVADLGESIVNSSVNEPLDIEAVKIHYLISGDTLDLHANRAELRVSLAGEMATNESEGVVTSSDVMYQDNFRAMATEMIVSGANSAVGTSNENEPTMTVLLSRSNDSIGTVNGERASYTNLRMTVQPQ